MFCFVYKPFKYSLLLTDIFLFAHLFCCAICLFLIDLYILNITYERKSSYFRVKSNVASYSPKVKFILLNTLMHNTTYKSLNEIPDAFFTCYFIYEIILWLLYYIIYIYQNFPDLLKLSMTMCLIFSKDSHVEKTCVAS